MPTLDEYKARYDSPNLGYNWSESPYEIFNTSSDILLPILTEHNSLMSGMELYDPCANHGAVLDICGAQGFTITGSDILPSDHPTVSQINIFDLDIDLTNKGVISIFRWGQFDGNLAIGMLDHITTLNPEFVLLTMCPDNMATYTPTGYSVTSTYDIPAEDYVTFEGAIVLQTHYKCILWSKDI